MEHTIIGELFTEVPEGLDVTVRVLRQVREASLEMDERVRRCVPPGADVTEAYITMPGRMLDRVITELESARDAHHRLQRQLREAKAFTVVASTIAFLTAAALAVVLVTRGTF